MQRADSTDLNLDYSQYSRVQKENLLALFQEKERRVNSRQILSLYPDTGPLRRELYSVHTKFFAASKKCRELCFMAANRCISPWTPIEMDHATRLPLEILGEQEFCVRSWDGENRCNKKASGLFLKSISPAFRVYLDNGSFFDCTRMHRLLTTAGWLSFDQLIHASSGLHCWQKDSDCQANYDKDDRLCDLLLQFQVNIAQELSPSQDDVLAPDHFFSQVDVAGHKYQYNHILQAFFPLPTEDDHLLIEDLCELFEDPNIQLDVRHKNGKLQELRQFADELILERAKQLDSDHQFFLPHASHVLSLCLDAEDSFEDYKVQSKNETQFLSLASPGQSNPLFHHDVSCTQIFFPCNSPYCLMGGQKIDYIVSLGCQPIIDFSVEDVKCYFSGGVIHHNSGKTIAGGYALTLHLTGQYPAWWKGKRFDRPVRSWACGTTGQTVRDVLQRKMLGPVNDLGTGLIPGDCIVDTKKKGGNVPDTIETVYVKHITGGISTMAFKSYEQGRKAYEGDEQDVILLDEEPPIDIYTECLTRTMTTQGIVMLLFTPLQGLSDTVLLFMPGGQIPSDMGRRFVIQATWDDAPHLSEKDKQDIIDSYLPHERDARSKGIPQLGSGRIYPVSEDELLVDDFEIPEHWIQAYGFDVGWKATAAVWGALNRESDVLYLHSCYKQGHEKPIIHAAAVKARGEWIPGLSDPAALGRGQRDGKQLMVEYNDLGLKLVPAENPVEAGILKLYKRMTTGRLKVFRSMVQWLEEFRIYRRDEKGKVIKDFDHLMDCLHPDTLVITDQGKIKIKDLVGTKGLVLSTDGKWLPYENCKRYGQDKPVVEVTFNDGSKVICTPDHKFLTSQGWVNAIDLQGLDCYNAVSQAIQGENQCKSISYLTKNKNLKEKFITYVDIISNEMGLDYIVRCGKAVMEKFPKGIVSTIKTRIGQITIFLIWNYCCFRRILHFTKKDMIDHFLKMLLMQPQNGMVAQTASDGTNNITKILKTDCTKKPNLFANFAEKNLSQKLQGKIDFAQTTANRLGDAKQDLTISKKFVRNAEKSLFQTSTTKHRHAHPHVELKSVDVKPAGKSDVYCLEVPGTHAFAIENGAIVHNCSRYLNNSIVTVGIIRPADETIFIPGAGSNLVSGWAR